jgi:mycothiol synthase
MTSGPQETEWVEWRPLTGADLQAVFELEAAGEAFDDHAVEVSLADIEDDWCRPDFDPMAMSMGAFFGGRLVAYALVFQGRAEALVHPEYRGKGLGTSLAQWTWEVARSEGRERVGQTISDNETSAAALFASLGYQRRHAAWIFRLDLARLPSAASLPTGYAFRPYLPGVDDRDIYELIDGAFAEWRNADSESMGFENWVACGLQGALPTVVVLVEWGDCLVGAAVGQDYGPGPHGAGGDGWIYQLAVRREHRRKGLGRALLEETFRRFRDAGRTSGAVSTDSRTGALEFYQRSGMTVERSYTRWAKIGL